MFGMFDHVKWELENLGRYNATSIGDMIDDFCYFKNVQRSANFSYNRICVYLYETDEHARRTELKQLLKSLPTPVKTERKTCKDDDREYISVIFEWRDDKGKDFSVWIFDFSVKEQ